MFYFLKHELFTPITEDELDSFINKYINVFVKGGYILDLDHNMLALSGDGYEELLILSNSIRLNLVRYLIAVTLLRQINDGTLTKNDFVTACVDLCKEVPSEVTNNSPEFADPIMFNIMCDTFVRHSYFSYSENGTIIPEHNKIVKLAQAAEPLLAAKLVRHLKTEIENIKSHNVLGREAAKAAQAEADAKRTHDTEAVSATADERPIISNDSAKTENKTHGAAISEEKIESGAAACEDKMQSVSEFLDDKDAKS